MRLLFLDHSSVIGGAELILVNYLKYLPRKSFETYVACSNEQPFLIKQYQKYATDVLITKFGKLKNPSLVSVLNFIETLVALVVYIRRKNIDVVFANTERAAYSGTLAAFLTGERLVWQILDYKYNKLLMRFLMLFKPSVICVSRSIRDFYGFGKEVPVFHVTSDMYRKLERVGSKDVGLFRKKYNLVGKMVVGYVGTLVEWKGCHVLLEAARFLDTKKIALLIVGAGPEMGRLKKMGVGVFTGFMGDVSVALKSMDVFVHPALEPEPYATSIVEAMMAGLPVVAPALGGTREILQNSKNGLFFRPGNPQSLARALEMLEKDRELIKKLGRAGMERVMRENRIEVGIERLRCFLESL